MSTYLDLVPLYPEKTLVNIQSEMDATATEDATPENAVDVRPGSLYYTATRPLARGLAKAWDALSTEVVAASKIVTAWGPYLDLHAEEHGLTRKDAVAAEGTETFVGEPGTLLAAGIRLGMVQTDADVEPPTFVTTDSGTIPGGGTIELPIAAEEPGADGNVGEGVITLLLTPVVGPSGIPIASVTNDDIMAGGVDVETDEELRERLRLEFKGGAGGNVADYERWAMSISGVGRVRVVPHHLGPGTVLVIVSTPDGSPVAPSVVADLQDYLDPDPSLGAGVAPIGHAVTVATVVLLSIDVVGTVIPEDGYTLDGAGGTVALTDEITDAIAAYVNFLKPGETVIYEHVKSAFFNVVGVRDISGVTVEGGTSNVTVTTSPTAQVARLATVTLS